MDYFGKPVQSTITEDEILLDRYEGFELIEIKSTEDGKDFKNSYRIQDIRHDEDSHFFFSVPFKIKREHIEVRVSVTEQTRISDEGLQEQIERLDLANKVARRFNKVLRANWLEERFRRVSDENVGRSEI